MFRLLSDLTQGRAEPADLERAAGAVGVEGELGVRLAAVEATLGTLEDDPQAERASLALHAALNVLGFELPLSLRLSDRELRIGLDRVDVPLRLPALPLTVADLPVDASDAAWQAAADALAQDDGDGAEARRAMLGELTGIRARLDTEAARESFHGLARTGLELLEQAIAAAALDGDLAARFDGIVLRVPLHDPRGIAVDGTVGLAGLPDDHVFKPLESILLRAGVSADQFFFALETEGGPLRIDIPRIGRYEDGWVEFRSFAIGFGWTKRSFVLSAAGGVGLPPALLDDVDTAQELGIGVRPPLQTRLGFRIDLMPVPAPIFVVPMVQFDLDMREDVSPPLADPAVCRPAWEGAQVHVPGVVRLGVKRVALSPFFGPLPAPNLLVDADLELGDERNGLRIVADDVLVVAGLLASGSGAVVPVATLLDPYAPYLENVCVDLRVAGFVAHFHLRRPLPSLSPFALFELLGLIADPKMPVRPDGPLAESVRIELVEARIGLPEWLHALFPNTAGAVEKPLSGTINLGSMITASQVIAEVVEPAVRPFLEQGAAVPAQLAALADDPPDVTARRLLALLPPELRKVALGGRFAGFEARAVLVLIDPRDAAQELSARGFKRRRPDGAPVLGEAMAADVARFFQPVLDGASGRVHDPADPTGNLFAGKEFAGFTVEDLGAVPGPRRPQAGIVVGAHVKLFAGQRARFIGSLWEDGSFAFVSRAELAPLRLRAGGLQVELDLEAEGRLRLSGRAKRDGSTGQLEASASARWAPVAGLDLALGRHAELPGSEPARLTLRADGTFALAGPASLRVAGALLTGAADIAHDHVHVDGTLDWAGPAFGGAEPVATARVSGLARVASNGDFALAGDGEVTVLGHPLAGARVTVARELLELSGELATGPLTLPGGLEVDDLRLDATGRVDLEAGELRVAGSGGLDVLGASVRGRGEVRIGPDGVHLGAEGVASWHGRPWLAVRAALGPDGTEIGGRVSLGFDTATVAGPNVAGVALDVDLDAVLRFRLDGSLRSFDVEAGATLGIRTVGPDGQRLPLAFARVAKHDVPGEVKLFDLPHLNLPLPDLPVVTGVSAGGEVQVDEYQLALPGGQLPFPWIDGMDPPPDPLTVKDGDGDPGPARVAADPHERHTGVRLAGWLRPAPAGARRVPRLGRERVCPQRRLTVPSGVQKRGV